MKINDDLFLFSHCKRRRFVPLCVSATKRALRFDKKAPAKKKTKRATIINGFGEASSFTSKARFVSKKRTLFFEREERE